MKSRPAPRPINYKTRLDGKLKYDKQVIKWAKCLAGDPQAEAHYLTEEQLAFFHLEVLKRRNDLSAEASDLYVKVMHDTCPILAAAPDMDQARKLSSGCAASARMAAERSA